MKHKNPGIDRRRIGAVLKALRYQRGLRQREIADQLGLTINYVCLVEQGTRGLSLEGLAAFADAYQTPVPLILALADDPRRYDPHSAEIIRQFRELAESYIRLPTTAPAFLPRRPRSKPAAPRPAPPATPPSTGFANWIPGF